MKIIRINKDSTMNDIDLKVTSKNLLSKLNKNAVSKGNKEINELYKWIHNNTIVKCYGWYDGEAGFENKHDLPPSGKSKFLDEDSSAQLLFGDIFLVRIDNKKLCDFQVSDYGEFYNIIFGGFDDCDTETDSEDINSEEEEDPDYDPDINDIEEEYEILSENDSELEEDTSEY